MKIFTIFIISLLLSVSSVYATSSKISRIVLHARKVYNTTNAMIRKQTLKGTKSPEAIDYIKDYTYYKLVLTPSKKNPSWLKRQHVEYYFDQASNLVFIFIYQGKKEERLYLSDNVRDLYDDRQKTKVYRYIDHKKKIRDNNNGLKISKRLSAIVEYGILVRNETYTGLDDAHYWNTRKQAKKSE